MKSKVTENRESDSSKVFIPGSISWGMINLISELKSRISSVYCEKARKRKGRGEKLVTEEECLQAVCEVLPQFAKEVEQSLQELARKNAPPRRASRRVA